MIKDPDDMRLLADEIWEHAESVKRSACGGYVQKRTDLLKAHATKLHGGRWEMSHE